ncbi:MAG: M4 family metallopeptidase [Proteobacteria bacterium]|nr:M4 family metallopeptidase [Pseudomonadota bacterium]
MLGPSHCQETPMPFSIRTVAPCLAAVLVVAIAQAQAVPARVAASSQRAAAGIQSLLARKSELGLGDADDFRFATPFTDELGHTHVRVQQLYKGVRVWGGDAVVHVGAAGEVRALTNNLAPRLKLSVTPGISAARARVLAIRHLGFKGTLLGEPDVELVVYPNPGGPHIQARWDKAQRRFVLDSKRSVFGRRVAGSHMLAYHVHVAIEDAIAGTHQEDLVLDARDGLIVDRWDSLKSDAPATATGHSNYSGDQTVDVLATGSAYLLVDQLRSNSYNIQADGSTSVFPTYHPQSGLHGIGVYDLAGATIWPNGQHVLFDSPTAEFGNGQLSQFQGWAVNPTDPTDQTAGVDAMVGFRNAYDMFDNVLGRQGPDGMATPIYLRVHHQDANAWWDDATFSITLGDLQAGNPWQTPTGVWGTAYPFTTVDIVAHEFAHGVTSSTANFLPSGEPGGLSEATSDIFGSMAEFYFGGAASQGAVVPDTGGNWTIGEQLMASVGMDPIRWLDHPSRDGASPDAWFYGIGFLDPHFSSGPLNRMFYFLSQGASADAGDHHSIYLPAGFAGIGNDKATRIWYRALWVYLTPYSGYFPARLAALYAGADLYPGDAVVQAAIENAFAAINVGPAHGAAARPLVTFNASESFFSPYLSMTSAGDPIKVYQAQVVHATDQTVKWSAPQGGEIQPDGTYTAPIRVGGWTFPIVATSVEDPLEFAQGWVYPVNMDLNDDTLQDATDMGEIALRYGAIAGDPRGNWDFRADLFYDQYIDDLDVATYLETFNRLYGDNP